MAKVKTPKTGLTTKHWFGYMFGDWGGCMTFALMGSLFTMYCTNARALTPPCWVPWLSSGPSGTQSTTP